MGKYGIQYIDKEKLYSASAEAAVLGSICLSPDSAVPLVSGYLPYANMFFMPNNQEIYDCLLSMYISKQSIDGVLLRNELEKRNKLEEIGGVKYLVKVLQSVPTSTNAAHYAKIVLEKYNYRNIIKTLELFNEAVDNGENSKELITLIRSKVFELGVSSTKPKYLEFNEAVRIAGEEKEIGIPTGFRNIDYYIGGLVRGTVTIIAGRPSVGKSCLMLGIAENIAQEGYPCLIFTLETSEESLIRRAILSKEPEEVAKLPIIASVSGETVEEQIWLFQQFQRTHGIKCVFIDYLQLMRTKEKFGKKYEIISELSRLVKRFAVDENIPIVLVAQLNRMSEGRDHKTPRMSDLRDSGNVEQDADVIILLARDEDGTRAIIAKNRDGQTGLAKLVFFPEQCKFEDKYYGTETYQESDPSFC